MNIPKIGFGKGFAISRNHGIGAKPLPVDVSNGMPIVSHKKILSEKQRGKIKGDVTLFKWAKKSKK